MQESCLAKGEDARDSPTGRWRQEGLCLGLGKRCPHQTDAQGSAS